MLDISLSLMGFVFVVFIVSLIILNQLLYKPLISFMDKRSNTLKADAADVKSTEEETKEISKKIQEILDSAKKEASIIRERAFVEAKNIANSMMEQKQKELKAQYDKFLSELEDEKVNLKNRLLSQVPLFKESLKAKISRL